MQENKQKGGYHVPVLLGQSIDYLISEADGIYVDVTFGGGGHSQEILRRLGSKGVLFGFDQDVDAIENVIEDERFVFVQSNFSYIKNFIEFYNIGGVDGVLADLGVSSHHFDDASRGFSYRFDAELDMRMNQSAKIKASDLLNSYKEEELVKVFSEFGEVRNSKTLAKEIVASRRVKSIQTVSDLSSIIDKIYRGDKLKYLSQVYQALRIEVNEEFEVLKRMLIDAGEMLRPGGSLVVISYHSLEDKIVKQFFRDNNFSGQRLEDDFGRSIKTLKPVSNRPIVPDDVEVKRNSRATSAKMRVAVKL